MASLYSKVHERKKYINEVDLLKQNQDLFKELWQECKERNSIFKKRRTYRRKRRLTAYIRYKNILCFRIVIMEIKT